MTSLPSYKLGNFRFRPGPPRPFGATVTPDGINFSIFSCFATSCSLVLFQKGAELPMVEIPFLDSFRTGDVYAMTVLDLDPAEIEYGFRLDGPFDPANGPKLPVEDWNEVRSARALRNYSVEYVSSHVVALLEMFGLSGTRAIVEHASRVTYVQLTRKIIREYNLEDVELGPEAFALYIKRDRDSLHEEVEIEQVSDSLVKVRQHTRNPRLFPPSRPWPPEIEDAKLQGWRLLAHEFKFGMDVKMTSMLVAGDPYDEWEIRA